MVNLASALFPYRSFVQDCDNRLTVPTQYLLRFNLFLTGINYNIITRMKFVSLRWRFFTSPDTTAV